MIEIRRAATRVELDDLGGGLQIVRITGAAGSFEFAPAPIFAMAMWKADGSQFSPPTTVVGQAIPALPLTMTPVDPGGHPPQVEATADRVTIHWSVRHWFIDALQLVTVDIWIDESETVNLHITVRNRLVNFALVRVQFPILRIKSVGEPGNNVLAMPWQQGGVMRDPAHTVKPENVVTAFVAGGTEPALAVVDFPHPGMQSAIRSS